MPFLVFVEISKALKKSGAVFSSDTVDVLWWLRYVSRRFKPFVANTVSAIQGSSSFKQWRYVPTKKNPADIATKGVTGTEPACSEIW